MQQAKTAHPVTIKRMDFPAGRRVLAAGDIHGEGELFLQALEKARFCKDDILVLVGDYLRHGRENLKTLRMLMELCRSHTVIPLCGNNDLFILDYLENPDSFWEETFLREFESDNSPLKEMAEEIGLTVSPASNIAGVRQTLREAFPEELRFLRELPTILETERFLFVHGGLPIPDLSTLEGTDAYACTKFDRYMDAQVRLPKYTVVGHWPTTLYRADRPCNNPLVNDGLRLISIDGGCTIKRDGQINVLVLPPDFEDGQFPLEFVSCDGLPQYRVLEGQEASHGSSYVHWANPHVELMAEEEDFSIVKHLSTGNTLRVPSDMLREREGGLSCGDYTDYCLGVSKGDTVSLVFTSPEGAFIKKDGCSGWFRPGLLKLKPL